MWDGIKVSLDVCAYDESVSPNKSFRIFTIGICALRFGRNPKLHGKNICYRFIKIHFIEMGFALALRLILIK